MTSDNTPKRAAEKWKEAGQAGFQLLPDVLLKNQAELGLASNDLIVLINVTMHWWYEGQRPFPRTTVIAKRMGLDPRTVQRSMKRLINLGLVRRITENKGTDEEREVFDLSGLVDALRAQAVKDPDYLVRMHRKKEELE
ncbi:MAG: helix-turn-helix domain-containing protein [Labrenzia sp.]